jgi:hypothetical protein
LKQELHHSLPIVNRSPVKGGNPLPIDCVHIDTALDCLLYILELQ